MEVLCQHSMQLVFRKNQNNGDGNWFVPIKAHIQKVCIRICISSGLTLTLTHYSHVPRIFDLNKITQPFKLSKLFSYFGLD